MSRARPAPAKAVATDVDPLIPALHTLALRLRSDGDVRTLLPAVREVFLRIPSLGDFHPESVTGASDTFAFDAVTVPLVTRAGVIGTLRVTDGDGGGFGRARMRLASVLADVTSAVIENAVRAGGGHGSDTLTSLAFDLLPVGVVGFDPLGGLLFANTRAQELLGRRVPANWSDVWLELAPTAKYSPGTPFVIRNGSRIVQLTAAQAEGGGAAALVLVDLGPQVTGFCDVLAAKLYGAMLERTRFALGVVAGPDGSALPLTLLESVERHLPPGCRVGPIDSGVAGVAVSGMSPSAVRAVIARMVRSTGGPEMRVGVAASLERGDTPEAILARAVEALQPVAVEARPEVFVFDRSASVSGAMATALRGQCSVTCASERDHAMRVVNERVFDALVLEISPAADAGIVVLARDAISSQADVGTIFVSDEPGPWNLRELGLPESPVFRKPFPVQMVREAVRQAATRSF